MNKAKAIEVANGYFPSYPDVHEFHITSDEQVFEDVNHARNHANSLDKGKQDVVSIKRDDEVEGASDSKESGTPMTDEQKLEAAKQKLANATADLQTKQQALNDADSKKKGAATVAVNKATSALQVAKDELAELTK